MSDTTTDATRTLHITPAPEPLAQLTGAPAAIYTELTGLTESATAAELAVAAGLGRSTTGKALTTLEEHGLAVRTPGGHDGPRRTPDRWRAALTPETNGDVPRSQEPASTEPESPVTDGPDPIDNGTSHEDARADESALDDDSMDTPTVPANILPGEKKRLAPGALRHMVIAHLQAHPGEAFTATKISRVIEKSSGAIANALVTLTRQGITEQVNDRPRTYRLAAPEGNG